MCLDASPLLLRETLMHHRKSKGKFRDKFVSESMGVGSRSSRIGIDSWERRNRWDAQEWGSSPLCPQERG